MLNLEYFIIQLQNPSGVYRPGDTVAGTIAYKVTQRGPINQVRLAATGDGYVCWLQRRTTTRQVYSHAQAQRRTQTTGFSGYELFYQFVQVYEARSGSADFYLEAGEYSHPFQFVLPPVLPSSVEHPNGRNRYTILGVVETPSGFNKYCQRVISVISPVDLNALGPALRQPSSASQVKTVCCLCWETGPIVIKLTIPKGGYVPGETLFADLSVENPSSKSFDPPVLVLRQVLHFNSTGGTEIGHRPAASVATPRSIEPKRTELFEGLRLVIPPTCPSTLNTCRVFQVAYDLTVSMRWGGPAFGDTLSIPIVIGTVPLGAGAANAGASQAFVQPSVFGGIENQNLNPEPLQGEAVSSDAGSFQPQYPFFKDFSI